MCALTAASACASSVGAERSCRYGAVCFSMFNGGTARLSVTWVAAGSAVSRTRDGSGTRTLTSARVLSSVKSFRPSSASIDRNSGSVASGLERRARSSRCHRASTVAGDRLKPSCGLWQVAQERPLPLGYGRKKLTAPRTSIAFSLRERHSPAAAMAALSASILLRMSESWASSSLERRGIEDSVHTSCASANPRAAATRIAGACAKVIRMRTTVSPLTQRILSEP